MLKDKEKPKGKGGRKPLDGVKLTCTVSRDAMTVLDKQCPRMAMSPGSFISMLLLAYKAE